MESTANMKEMLIALVGILGRSLEVMEGKWWDCQEPLLAGMKEGWLQETAQGQM